jgi:hypothetical protein
LNIGARFRKIIYSVFVIGVVGERGSVVKKTLPLICLLALCNLNLFAQAGAAPRIVYPQEKSAVHVPPQEAPAGLKKIDSNLGSKTELYNYTSAYGLWGPNFENYGFPQFVAMPFTPQSDSHVAQVGVAVLYGGQGADQVNLSIYNDSSGAPGTLLAGPVTVPNLPTSCCNLYYRQLCGGGGDRWHSILGGCGYTPHWDGKRLLWRVAVCFQANPSASR